MQSDTIRRKLNRALKLYTPGQLAEALGVTRQQISNYKLGKTSNMSAEVFLRLHRLLKEQKC